MDKAEYIKDKNEKGISGCGGWYAKLQEETETENARWVRVCHEVGNMVKSSDLVDELRCLEWHLGNRNVSMSKMAIKNIIGCLNHAYNDLSKLDPHHLSGVKS